MPIFLTGKTAVKNIAEASKYFKKKTSMSNQTKKRKKKDKQKEIDESNMAEYLGQYDLPKD